MIRLRRHLGPLLTCVPGVIWISTFLVIPFLAIAVISVMSRGEYGEIQLPFTFGNYLRFLGYGTFGFDSVYPLIFARSFVLAAVTTALCF